MMDETEKTHPLQKFDGERWEEPPIIPDVSEQLEGLLPQKLSFLANNPKNYQMTNPKLINKMADMPLKTLVDAGSFDVTVSSRGSKTEAVITASIELNDDLKLSGNAEFTPYDKIVHDAVCTQWYAGNGFFTVDMIYRTMNGYTKTEKVPPVQKREIEASIHKMQSISLEADLTEHYKQVRQAITGDHVKIKDRLLSLKEITGTLQGAAVGGYLFNCAPILYGYSVAVKQLQSIPFELLDFKSDDKMTATAERTVIKMYLLERIGAMKSSKLSRTIRYETVIKKVERTKGVEKLSDKMARTTKQNIVDMLEILKKNKHINGYTEIKEGRAYSKVEILL